VFSENFAEVAEITDTRERLNRSAALYVRFALEHPNHYRLMFMTPMPVAVSGEAAARKGNPELDAYAFLRMMLVAVMEEGHHRRDLTDVDLVAQTVWAGIHGVVALEIAMTKNRDEWIAWRKIEDRVALMMDVLIRGLMCGEK
jgi:hypothetical protein